MRIRLAKSQVVTHTYNLYEIQGPLDHGLYFLIEQQAWCLFGQGQIPLSDNRYSVAWVDPKEADRILKENRNELEDLGLMSSKNSRPGEGGEINICDDDQQEWNELMDFLMSIGAETNDEEFRKRLFEKKQTELSPAEIEKIKKEEEIEAESQETDRLTGLLTAFLSFRDLLNAEGEYRPSLNVTEDEDAEKLADLYDTAQKIRGDARRASRY